MNIATLAVVFATVMGPVLAVQAQQWISVWRERRNRKLAIFRTLMATRANPLTAESVNAFNTIPIEFYGDEDVLEPWRIYFDHIDTKGMEPNLWADKRWDLYCALLLAISQHLKYGFDFLTIKKKIYAPEGHSRISNEQEAIRTAVLGLLTGKTTLPMEVRSFPTDTEAVQRINAVQIAMFDWLTGKITPKVRVEKE